MGMEQRLTAFKAEFARTAPASPVFRSLMTETGNASQSGLDGLVRGNDHVLQASEGVEHRFAHRRDNH